MSWHWEANPAPREPGTDIERQFDDQGAAEAWLTEHFESLQDAGVAEVTLYEADRLVYGPMSLDPA